jgi:nucleotide-binding universal stress UspA family protein
VPGLERPLARDRGARDHRLVAAPVLAAYDPVSSDRAPVRFGAAVAGVTRAPLIVASVYASDDVVGRLAGAQMGEELPREVGDALDQVARELRDGAVGLDVETTALGAASAPRALDLAVEELGAALLVVGSASRAQEGRVAPGSTSGRLLDGVGCAAAIVPRGMAGELGDASTVGAGFVDTVEGRAAVHGAQMLARRSGADLRVLTAVKPRSWMVAGGNGATEEDVASDVRTRAENAVQEAAGTLLGTRVDLDVEVLEPAEYLLAASSELDLLVCGPRTYGPSRATLLGGVTRRLIQEAACPVMVLARDAEVGLEALVDDDGD